jgi:hypothetical protein
MSLLLKVIYRFNAIPIKIPMKFFREKRGKILKFLSKTQRLNIQIVTRVWMRVVPQLSVSMPKPRSLKFTNIEIKESHMVKDLARIYFSITA